MRRPVLLLLALLLAVSTDLVAGACASLPRSGPVQSKAVQDNGAGDTLVDYTPPGPKPGSDPVSLVDGFLLAMTATPLNTYVAREFLTSGSGSRWTPEQGTVVYGSDQIVRSHSGRVTLRLHDVVELDSRGAWEGDPTSGHGRDYRIPMVKERGQWRIDHPPNRLLIPRDHFDTEYQQYLLYFFDRSAQVLVPEPVYLPRGRQTPTLLVSDLLKGPEPSLRGVERTFFPTGTSLDGISVPVSTGGTAEVPLSDQVLDVDDKQLNLLFAQMAWTLQQVTGVQRMRITVGGTPVDLPRSPESVRVDNWPELDPAVTWASTALFGIRDHRTVTIGPRGESRLQGPSGVLPLGLRSVAVDLLAQHVAGVSHDGRKVLVSPLAGVPGHRATMDDVRTRYTGRDVLRPAYDLYGQLWVVDRTGSGARFSVIRAGRARTVTAPGLSGADVFGFVVSRDGTRLVAQVRRHGRDELDVARVGRDTEGRVRRISAAQPLSVDGAPARIRDFGWRSPTRLAVLVKAPDDTSQVLLAKVDGSSTVSAPVSDALVFSARADDLVASPAADSRLYVRSTDGRLHWFDAGGQWVPSRIKPGLQAPTFVG